MPVAQAIHAAMTAAGFTRDRSISAAMRFVGALQAAGRPIAVAVEFPDDSLTEPPRLQLLNRGRDLPNALAHIEDENRVCYVQQPELLLDPHEPAKAVSSCLAIMARSLDRLARLDLSDEIAREFPQSWRPEVWVYVDTVWRSFTNAFMYVLERGSNSRFVLAENSEALARYTREPKGVADAKKTAKPVTIIPVTADLTFRAPHRPPTNLAETLAWGASLQPGLDATIREALAKQDPDHLTFFLSAPNGTVGARLILPPALRQAIQRPRQFLPRLLNARSHEIPIMRMSGTRADADFLYDRNLAGQPSLAGNRVVLVGLGTIGGYLGKFLVQSGAGHKGGQITFVDKQSFTPGNVGRHLLGLASTGRNKAEACRDFLAALYPDNDITAVADDAWRHLDALSRYHLLIDATGDEAVSFNLNRHFVGLRVAGRPAPNCLHIWLKGNGVATQALLVDTPTSACFRCLRQLNGSERYPVLKADHPAHLTPANCGEGAYFAYGVGASVIAAGLAAQMSLDWARAQPAPRFRTLRVVQDATMSVKDQNPQRLEGCPACALA
jgi:molybdopterin/thiamine biosynthesis adenylyltransferase